VSWVEKVYLFSSELRVNRFILVSVLFICFVQNHCVQLTKTVTSVDNSLLDILLVHPFIKAWLPILHSDVFSVFC